MQKYVLSNFRGMFPRLQAYLINNSAAQTIIDGNTVSGGLEAFRQDSLVRTVDKVYTDMYRYTSNGDTRWLLFDDPVDIVRSAVIDDVSNLTYIVGPDGLRAFDKNSIQSSTSNTVDSTNSVKAGISAPSKATLQVVSKYSMRSVTEEAAPSATTITVTKSPAGGEWPPSVSTTDPLLLKCVTPTGDIEYVKCTSITSSTTDSLTVVRAQEGTTAITLPIGTQVSIYDPLSQETRVYCFAYGREWVSGKLDMGPASPAAETADGVAYVDIATGDAVVVSDMPRLVGADEGTNKITVYRSAVGSAGEATWREVITFSTKVGALLPTSVTYDSASDTYTFTDTVKTEDLGNVPTNLEWTCPDGLQGIITLRNGIFAAYKNNTLYLSVPYQGHAWPEAYAIPLDFNIVGLGCIGNTVVVFTTNKNFLCTASNPESVILIPLHESSTCVSKRSIVSLQESVLYATGYGISRITTNGVEHITNAIMSEAVWKRYNPETIQACSYQGKYLMFFKSNKVPYSGCIVDLADLSMGMLGLSQTVSCLRADDYSTDIFVQYIHPITLDSAIFTFATSSSLRRVYRFTSKKFLNTYGLTTLSCGKVNFYKDSTVITPPEFNYTESYNPFNGEVVNLYTINGDINTNDYTMVTHASDWCRLSYYMDDTLRHTADILDNTPFRLPAGFRGDSFYFDIVSTQPIARIQLASGIGELE